MKEKTKKIIAFSALLTASLLCFGLMLFAIPVPDGIFGYILFTAFIATAFFSTVKLVQHSSGKTFGEAFIITVFYGLAFSIALIVNL